MKNDVTYIVYNPDTLKIAFVCSVFNAVGDEIRKNNSLAWCNITHPKSKQLVIDINNVNGTDYGKKENKNAPTLLQAAKLLIIAINHDEIKVFPTNENAANYIQILEDAVNREEEK